MTVVNKKRKAYRFHPVRRATTFQKLLGFCALLIIAGTLIGTAVAFTVDPHRLARKQVSTEPVMLPSRPADPIPSPLQNQGTFTLLGKLRSGTGDDPSIPLVVEPWFYYDTTDIQFYQELQQKSRKIRTVITDYFPRYTREELMHRGEQSVKEQLRTAINRELVLGTIEQLYFNDYTFLD